MRDVDQPKGDRQPDADCGVKAAEEDPGDYRLE